MKYLCFGKKSSLLLALICLVQFGFANTLDHSFEPQDSKLIVIQEDSQHPQKTGLQHGHLESSIRLKSQKYAPLTKTIYEVRKKQPALYLPSIVVDDVIVMLHDTPHSLYTKTSRSNLERSPG